MKKYIELKKKVLGDKKNELLVLQLTADYLKERIEKYKEKERQANLVNVKKSIDEVKKQIAFFKKK